MALDETEVRRDIILALVPTASFAMLQPSAKDQIIGTADMLVNYIFGAEGYQSKTTGKPSKSGKGQRASTPT